MQTAMQVEIVRNMTVIKSKIYSGYSAVFAGSGQSFPKHQSELDGGYMRNLHGMKLEVAGNIHDSYSKNTFVLIIVTLAHVLAIYFLAQKTNTQPPAHINNLPMHVSLIASAAPEIVPVIELPKPIIETKPKLKKAVEKIKPVETPTERLVEATTELAKEDASHVPAERLQEIAEAKVAPQTEHVVEEKIEPPKFGVAYLNNPAPAYPSLSRRAGEEGRVLLRVLVSEGGEAIDVQLDKSSGSERLDQAAMTAVKNWRFIPARKNNQALSAYVLVPIKFSLNG